MKKYLSLVTICLLFTLSGYSFTQIVSVKNFTFSPATFTINIGDTIQWVYAAGTHTTTSLTIPTGAAAWDHPVNSSSTTFTYVPTKAGIYNYKCTFHFAMGMKGDFTVVCPQISASISAASATTFCQGGSVVLKSNVSSSFTSYQWKKNGTAITNATNANYTAKTTGGYTLVVTNNCAKTATSNTINVTVNPLPGATISPAGTVSICTGDSIKLKANTGSSNTYKWKRNGVNIPGATSSIYFAKKEGNYKVVVTKTTTGCSKASAATIIEINCANSIAAKLPANKIEIFPNPSANDFHIAIPAYNSNQFSLAVYDANGRLIRDSKISSANFSFGSELKPGIYFVEVKHANVVVTKEKIIKK